MSQYPEIVTAWLNDAHRQFATSRYAPVDGGDDFRRIARFATFIDQELFIVTQSCRINRDQIAFRKVPIVTECPTVFLFQREARRFCRWDVLGDRNSGCHQRGDE